MRISDWSSDVCSSDLPARIIRAFQDSVHDLQVDFPIKLVIYKLFDRVVVGRMSEVFSGANHLLAGHGVEPKESATAPKRNPAAAAFAGSDATHPMSPAPAWASGVNAGRFSQFMGDRRPHGRRAGAVPPRSAPRPPPASVAAAWGVHR